MRKQKLSTNHANQETGWVFLAEDSLDGWIRRVAGLQFQELDLPPEYLIQMIRTLADFAHPGTPAVVRLFCQDTLLKDGNLADRLLGKQSADGPEIIFSAVPKMSGGWGYFLIERNGDFSEDRPASSLNFIDLYLYREGK